MAGSHTFAGLFTLYPGSGLYSFQFPGTRQYQLSACPDMDMGIVMAGEIRGYIVDVETRERLEFQYNPSDIGDDKSAQFADIRIPGISHPRQQFVAGGGRHITFIC
jgi:hypothetical protein